MSELIRIFIINPLHAISGVDGINKLSSLLLSMQQRLWDKPLSFFPECIPLDAYETNLENFLKHMGSFSQDSLYQMELCGIQFISNRGLYLLHVLRFCPFLCARVQEYWKGTLEF